MCHGASIPTRLLQAMKYPLATACAGCSSFQRYCDRPATVADGLNTISAPFNPSARAPSGKWRALQKDTATLGYGGWKTGQPRLPRLKKKFFQNPWAGGGEGFFLYCPR